MRILGWSGPGLARQEELAPGVARDLPRPHVVHDLGAYFRTDEGRAALGDYVRARHRALSGGAPAGPDPVAQIYVSTASDEADVQGILDLLISCTQQSAGAAPGSDAVTAPALARAA